MTCKECTTDDDSSLDPEQNKTNTLEADDSQCACIPAWLQLANSGRLESSFSYIRGLRDAYLCLAVLIKYWTVIAFKKILEYGGIDEAQPGRSFRH